MPLFGKKKSNWQSNKSPVVLTKSLGKGADGEVWQTDRQGVVAKLYKPETIRNHVTKQITKLRYMVANPIRPPNDPALAIAWPRELFMDSWGHPVGFLMPECPGRSLIEAYHPTHRKRIFPDHTWQEAIATAHDLALLVAHIHQHSHIVIGDLNPNNIRIHSYHGISIIDTDSFQISVPGQIFPCIKDFPEYQAPEVSKSVKNLGGRDHSQDCFALAILIYQVLMCGEHPYDGVYQGEKPAREEAVKRGYTVLDPSSPFKPKPGRPSPHHLPKALFDLFYRALVQGHSNPSIRPRASEWESALYQVHEKGIRGCQEKRNHKYAKELSSCPWCGITKAGGGDLYPFS